MHLFPVQKWFDFEIWALALESIQRKLSFISIGKNDVAKYDFVLFILCKSNIMPELGFIVFPTHSLGTIAFYTYTLTGINVGILKSVTATVDIETQCTRTVTVGTDMQTHTHIQFSCLALSLIFYRYDTVYFCTFVLVFFDNHHCFGTHYRDYRGEDTETRLAGFSTRKRFHCRKCRCHWKLETKEL